MYPRQQRMLRAAEAEEEQKQLVAVKAEDVHGSELAPLEEDPEIKDARAVIAACEDELACKAAELDAKEARLEAATAAAGGDGPVIAAQWAALAAARQALAGRLMCLAEDKKALAAALALRRRRGGGMLRDGEDPEPFEPGSLPISDVRCAIIAHQVDIPLSSCCFQR